MYKQNLALNNLQYAIKPNQIYKEDLALNYLQWMICHKTQPNQIQCYHYPKLAANQCYRFSLPYFLFIAEEKTDGFMLFRKQCKMQTASRS